MPASVDVLLRHVHTHKSSMSCYEILVFREFCGNRWVKLCTNSICRVHGFYMEDTTYEGGFRERVERRSGSTGSFTSAFPVAVFAVR